MHSPPRLFALAVRAHLMHACMYVCMCVQASSPPQSSVSPGSDSGILPPPPEPMPKLVLNEDAGGQP